MQNNDVRMRLHRWCALLLGVVACLATVDARAQAPASCSPAGKNLYVRDRMTDIYFWYRELPTLDPVSFDTPEAYLDAIRFRPIDNTYSFITDRASNTAFFSDSQFVGLGLSTSIAGDEMRVLQVFPDSPAEEAGLARGDFIIEINGRTVADLIATGAIDTAFGASEIGIDVSIVFRHPAGGRTTVDATKRLVTIPTVSLTRVYDVAGRKIGYVFFRNFVQPSIAALDAAFNELVAAGVSELVLDLRYNGGGLINVAQHLASLIGGVRTEGQPLAEYFHNDKNAFRNQTIRFQSKPNALRLDRLVVITTRASASASELIINALRPFIPVLIVGDRTYGKPVGQYQFEFCDKVLAPVSFTLRNSKGEGDFYDGFTPDCPAADDIGHQIGDAQEASVREALTLIDTGACSAPAPLTRRAQNALIRRSVGWQSVVNAY
jgi:carboxyl-terminal processing protease